MKTKFPGLYFILTGGGVIFASAVFYIFHPANEPGSKLAPSANVLSIIPSARLKLDELKSDKIDPTTHSYSAAAGKASTNTQFSPTSFQRITGSPNLTTSGRQHFYDASPKDKDEASAKTDRQAKSHSHRTTKSKSRVTLGSTLSYNSNQSLDSSPGSQQVEASPTFPASLVELPADVKLTPYQQKNLDHLAQKFVEDIGGTNQDPDDSAYLVQWNEATTENDSQYKLLFGSVAYVQQQLRASQAAIAETTASHRQQ